MASTWTFGRKLGTGLAIKAAITLIMAVVAIFALQYVIAAKDEVISKNARVLMEAEALENFTLERPGTVRAYLLTGDTSLLAKIKQLGDDYFKQLDVMRTLVTTPEEIAFLDILQKDAKAQFDAGDAIVTMRKSQRTPNLEAIGVEFQEKVVPLFNAFRDDQRKFIDLEQKNLDDAKARASQTGRTAMVVVVVFAVVGVSMGIFLAVFLTRTLTRQIGSAVQHIQSSSAELQAAANQQTAGSKEQVASMSEISATIKQLMSTARQIATSAQGVAHIAQDASAAAAGGDTTVAQAQGETTAIRTAVDLVVEHMLDLGRKSQQIGGIPEIINELAEQTNILAINATIEAAGAGESGKRFSVVADEIRRLADRVGGSTKEIRVLIDEVRSAVNASVMATESGSKAVDAGTKQFVEVANAFRQISDLLRNTTEAAREIELSTKQQSTAVEQVNVAVANVAQAAREAEASSGQVLQTVGELNTLSTDLGKLVQAQKA